MHKEYLEKWLRDAYAMELAAIEMLEKQSNRTDDYPQVQKRVSQHLELSKWQADEVKKCLKDLGTDVSVLKNVTGKLMANIAALTNATNKDEIIKSFIANSSFEHLEIASYRSLIAAAQECDEPTVQATCEQILQQEEEMARWYKDNIQYMTKEFLSHQPVIK